MMNAAESGRVESKRGAGCEGLPSRMLTQCGLPAFDSCQLFDTRDKEGMPAGTQPTLANCRNIVSGGNWT
jgi:hypothetical protein